MNYPKLARNGEGQPLRTIFIINDRLCLSLTGRYFLFANLCFCKYRMTGQLLTIRKRNAVLKNFLNRKSHCPSGFSTHSQQKVVNNLFKICFFFVWNDKNVYIYPISDAVEEPRKMAVSGLRNVKNFKEMPFFLAKKAFFGREKRLLEWEKAIVAAKKRGCHSAHCAKLSFRGEAEGIAEKATVIMRLLHYVRNDKKTTLRCVRNDKMEKEKIKQ